MHARCMHERYAESMGTVVQVRDVPDEVIAKLKQRADARGQSFAAYLRDLMTEAAATPSIEEVMGRIATRPPIRYSQDDVREFMNDGRR
jgi:antitoxin FitA